MITLDKRTVTSIVLICLDNNCNIISFNITLTVINNVSQYTYKRIMERCTYFHGVIINMAEY